MTPSDRAAAATWPTIGAMMPVAPMFCFAAACEFDASDGCSEAHSFKPWAKMLQRPYLNDSKIVLRAFRGKMNQLHKVERNPDNVRNWTQWTSLIPTIS